MAGPTDEVVPAPVAVGLVGAGPWAHMVHAPTFAAGPETHLAAIWARRPEAAARLAARHGSTAVADLDELLERCEVVASSVPPEVQADLAVRAAGAGRAVVLEKPIAADLDGADRLADAIGAAGVASFVVLTWRYADPVRRFVDDAIGFDVTGASGRLISSSLLAGPFATPWRLERGPLLDLGPHVVDLLDATVGEVVGARAAGDLLGWVSLVLDHVGGQTSTVALCATSRIDPGRAGVELYGPAGVLEIDCTASVDGHAFATLRREVAAAVRAGTHHPLDVGRGLHLQRILHLAEAQLLA